MTIQSINPATGETIKEYTLLENRELRPAIKATHKAYLSWRKTSFAQRATLMREAARILKTRTDDYARLMAEEMGKPVKGGRAEVEKCALVCDTAAALTHL